MFMALGYSYNIEYVLFEINDKKFLFRDPVLNQFASFWRPVVNLDIKIW